MLYRDIRNYKVRATTYHDLDTIQQHMENEDYENEDFKKYFHVWKAEGVGIYYFPRERYFASRNDVTNYAMALLQYVKVNQLLKEVD